jgi:hypothetical protein
MTVQWEMTPCTAMEIRRFGGKCSYISIKHSETYIYTRIYGVTFYKYCNLEKKIREKSYFSLET